MFAVLSLVGAAQAQSASGGIDQSGPEVSSQRGSASAGNPKRVNLGALPEASSAEFAAHPQPLAPLRGMDSRTYQLLKQQATGGPRTLEANSPAPTVPAAGLLTPGASVFFTSSAQGNCNCAPADQALAVGDTQIGVLQSINTRVNVFDKAGVLQPGYPKSLSTFFGLSTSTPVSDPRAIYDWINHRYILVMIDFSPNFSTASHYHIAVSNGDDPAGGYCEYTLPVESVAPAGGIFPLPDYPRIGQDRQAIYLASNIFNPNYKWEELLVLPKTQMYACQNISFPFFFDLNLGGTPTDTTQPANIFNPEDDPRSEYLVTSKNIFFPNPKNGLVVWAVHSPLSSPVLTGFVVGTGNNYSTPPNASQPGHAQDVDTGDNRISGTVQYAAGSLYASLNTSNGVTSAAILYQIQPFVNQANGNISGASIRNEIVHSNTTFDTYYATQQPDPEGNITTVWNFSSSATFPSLIYSSRRAGQPTNTEPDGGIFAIGGSAFYPFGRWGDYTATAPAGLGGSTPNMWFAGMYARSDGTWGTAIARNYFSSIAQP